MEKLALLGGDPVFSEPLNRYNSIGDEELKAATDVLKTGALSPFLGDWKDIPNVGSFYGGTKVREFERDYIEFLNAKHRDVMDTLKAGKLTDEVTDTLASVAKELSEKYKG